MWFQRKLVAHIETWRPYNSLYPGLLALSVASLWLHGLPTQLTALLIFVAPTLGWIAGLYGCDYFDRDLDAIEKGHRPIPSGRISDREAFMFMMIFMYFGFVASAWLGFGNLLLAGGVMAASVAYTVAKGHAILGNVSRGIPSAFTVLFAIAATSRGLISGRSFLFILALPLLFLLHDMTTNLIGTIRDVNGDRAGNYRTIPVKYGLKATVRLIFILALTWEIAALVLPWLFARHILDYYLLYLPALGFAILGLITVARRPEDRPAALLAHKYFVIERLLLSGALLAGGSGIFPALLVVLPIIFIVQLTQHILRDRHEFGPGGKPSSIHPTEVYTAPPLGSPQLQTTTVKVSQTQLQENSYEIASAVNKEKKLLRTQYDAIICGAGVGGLALAIALGRQGYQVLVIDKQRTEISVHKGELLQPYTLQIFQEWNVLPELLERGALHIEAIECRGANGDALGILDYRLLPHTFNYSMVHYYKEIKKAMGKVAEPLTEISHGRVVDVLRSPNGRITGVRVLSDGREEEISAKLVVGADGRTSFIRNRVGIPTKMTSYPHQMLALDLEDVPQLQSRILNFLSRQGIRALYPMPGERARLYVQVPIGEFKRFKGLPMGEWRQQLIETTPGLHIIAEHLPPDLTKAQILGNWHFIVPSWTKPGMVLIGDAAHCVHPMAGQGMNAAIIDAWTLTQCILEETQGKTWTENALDLSLRRYELIRRPQFRNVARLSHIMSALFTNTSPLVQHLALRSVHTNCTNRHLQYIVTYNMSGLGFRRFTWIDLLRQFGILPDPRASSAGL